MKIAPSGANIMVAQIIDAIGHKQNAMPVITPLSTVKMDNARMNRTKPTITKLQRILMYLCGRRNSASTTKKIIKPTDQRKPTDSAWVKDGSILEYEIPIEVIAGAANEPRRARAKGKKRP